MKKSGMTLIELLVIIVVFTILVNPMSGLIHRIFIRHKYITSKTELLNKFSKITKFLHEDITDSNKLLTKYSSFKQNKDTLILQKININKIVIYKLEDNILRRLTYLNNKLQNSFIISDFVINGIFKFNNSNNNMTFKCVLEKNKTKIKLDSVETIR